MSANFKRAKRGDLVALEIGHFDYMIGGPPTNRYGWEVGVVTNIFASGKVKAVRLAWMSNGASVVPLSRLFGLRTIVVASKDTVDVEAALQTAREHVYEGTSTIKAYSSREHLLAAMTPHRIAS